MISAILYNDFTYWFTMLWTNTSVWLDAMTGMYGGKAFFWSSTSLMVSITIGVAFVLAIMWILSKVKTR